MAYNPYIVVDKFEKMIAKWSGSRFGIAVESCSAALFLSCLYRKVDVVMIPKRTYPSVPCSIINAGGEVMFIDSAWEGIYELRPYNIIAGALRFKPGMYQGSAKGLHCLSFHMKKHLPIGRGGMILTNDEEAYEWLKKARFDGRDEVPLGEDSLSMIGWNMYMTPEQAVRGIQLFSTIDQRGLEDLETDKQGYQDLSKFKIYQKKNAISKRT